MEQNAQIAQYVQWSAIAQGLWALFFFIASAGIWFAIYKLTQILRKVEALLDPVADKSLHVMENVDQTLTSLRGRAESMLDASEKAVTNVAAKVDTTSSLVEGAVARPAIGISSVMAGINKGLEMWRQFEPPAGRKESTDAAAQTSPGVETQPPGANQKQPGSTIV